MKKFLFTFVGLLLLAIIFPFRLSTYANYRIDKIVFIDPGHGGYDPGTHSDEILEKEINLKIATNLYDLFIENSSMAFITRSGDYDLSSLNSKNHKLEDLNNRIRAIKNSGAEILISIHLNALRDTSVYGPMVYYRKNDEKSFMLAEIIQKKLNVLSGREKISHPETYFLFKHTTIPAVIIECGFLSNAEERRKLNDSSYQKQLANCIFESVYEFCSIL